MMKQMRSLAYFKVLYLYTLAETEENHENLKENKR